MAEKNIEVFEQNKVETTKGGAPIFLLTYLSMLVLNVDTNSEQKKNLTTM